MTSDRDELPVAPVDDEDAPAVGAVTSVPTVPAGVSCGLLGWGFDCFLECFEPFEKSNGFDDCPKLSSPPE